MAVPQQTPPAAAAVAYRTGSRALAWILENLEQFDPFGHGRALDEFHQTALAELALACFLLRRRAAARDAGVERCLDFLYSLYSKPAYHCAVFQEPRALAGHLLPWLALQDRGGGRLVPRSALEPLVEPASRAVLRWEPYRILELRYLLDLARLAHALPLEQEVFPATPLGSAAGLAPLSEAQLYGITHTICYLTDFGARASRVLAGEAMQRAQAALDSGMQASVEARNWDLVGEIILAYRCLGLADDGAVGVGWGALSAVQEPDGMVGQSLTFLPPAVAMRYLDDDRYRFQTCYHRTLVAVMAARIAPDVPGTRWPGPR